MALNLDDEEAIDYGSDVPLLPFDCYGEYDLDVIAYHELVDENEVELRKRELKLELGREPTEDELPRVAFNGSCDIATVVVKASDNPAVKVGQTWGLYFDTHATGKAKKFAIARSRQFVAALAGENPKDPNFKSMPARKMLLTSDLSSGALKVHLSRRPREGRGEYEGQTFANDRYTAIDG